MYDSDCLRDTLVRLRWVLLLLLAWAWASPAAAQSGMEYVGSARSVAMGRVSTADPRDAGPHLNPALRAVRMGATASFFAGQAFGLPELRLGHAHVRMPVRGVMAGAGAGTFGFAAYREVHGVASAARGVGLGTTRRIYLGIAARMVHTSIADYGSASTFSADVGMWVPVLPVLAVGAHATNLTGAHVTDGEPLARVLAVGTRYEPTRRVTLTADVVKDVAFPASMRVGLEVRPVASLALRGGTSTQPSRFAAGIGITLGSLVADAAAERHPALGWSPAAGLRLRW